MPAVAQMPRFLVGLKGYSFTVLYDADEMVHLERPTETHYQTHGSWYNEADLKSQLGLRGPKLKKVLSDAPSMTRPRYDLRSEQCQRLVIEAVSAADAKDLFLETFGIISAKSDAFRCQPAKPDADLGPVKHKSTAKPKLDPEAEEKAKKHQARKRTRKVQTKFPKGSKPSAPKGKPGRPKGSKNKKAEDAAPAGDPLLQTGPPSAA